MNILKILKSSDLEEGWESKKDSPPSSPPSNRGGDMTFHFTIRKALIWAFPFSAYRLLKARDQARRIAGDSKETSLRGVSLQKTILWGLATITIELDDASRKPGEVDHIIKQKE